MIQAERKCVADQLRAILEGTLIPIIYQIFRSGMAARLKSMPMIIVAQGIGGFPRMALTKQ